MEQELWADASMTEIEASYGPEGTNYTWEYNKGYSKD